MCCIEVLLVQREESSIDWLSSKKKGFPIMSAECSSFCKPVEFTSAKAQLCRLDLIKLERREDPDGHGLPRGGLQSYKGQRTRENKGQMREHE